MKKGVSRDQKRRIVQEFTHTLVATRGVDPGLVTVMFDEHDQENIGEVGKLRCD